MKNNAVYPSLFLKQPALLLSMLCCFAFVKMSQGQAPFSSTWPLTADQSYSITGAVTATNQSMSGTLFIPASNAYVGTTSGTAGDGQRCSPKQNDGNDGGWLVDGGAVEGRYMEFMVSPNAGYDMNVSTISFSVGNRSRSELKGTAYYYVGASNAGFTIATATGTLGTSLGASSTNQWNSYSFATSINVTSGNKIFVRIYPYNTSSNTTGKYYCAKSVVISGTTTTPNITNVVFTAPATCDSTQIKISWAGPAGFNPSTQTILAFLKAGSPITAGTPSSTLATYTANTVFGSGTNYQNDALGKCIYKGTGTDAFGNHSGLTITNLVGGSTTTYYLLIYVVTGTNTYATGITGSGNTLTRKAEPPTNLSSALTRTLQTTNSIPITWVAQTTGSPLPDGYMLQASNIGTPANPVDFTDLGNQLNLSGGTGNGKVSPNTTSNFTFNNGLAPGTMYYFKLNTYTNSGTCIDYRLASTRAIQIATLPNAVSAQSISINGITGVGTVSWTAGAGYNSTNNTTLVFIKSGSAVSTNAASSNPKKDPGLYTANSTFGSGSAYYFDPAAYCIYNGDATSCTVSGLTPGLTYYVLILTAVTNASNTSVSAVAGVEGGGATWSYSADVTAATVYGGTYTWNAGNTTGNWTTAANWTPNRISPATTDQLIFNTGENITPAGFTSQTIGTLTISNNTTLNMTASGQALTITNNNAAANDLIINSGSSLNISGGQGITLSIGTIADVSGTLNVNSFGSYDISASGAINTVSGTLKNAGTLTSTANNIIVTATGTYDHALNGGTIPTCVWNTGSSCVVSGITSVQTLNGHRQIFSKFIWDCAGQSNYFILGSATTGAGTLPPIFEVTDSFIVKRTNGQILQLTSSGGQRDVTCGNYIQYGGIVAVTYNTNDAGGQRSLSVYNSFYVSDSLANARFQIVNNTVDNTNGRLYVGGNVVMRLVNGGTVTLEKTPSASTAELWFTGTTNQYAQFSTVTDSVDVRVAQNLAGFNVTLGSNLKIRKLMLSQGSFNIAANTLTLDREVSYPTPGTGTIGGSANSNLTLNMNGNAGTLNFTSGSRILKDFTQGANNTVSLGTALSITAGTTPGRDSLGAGATLNTNDLLTLSSDANGTARMAQLPVNGSGVALATINGKVTVERYLPMTLTSDSRRWRLLTAPFKTTNAPTINAAWQEGASNPDRLNPALYDPKPGYGTHITRSTTFGGDGYDQGSTTNPSIFYYSAGAWNAPANTNSVKITDNGGCYMLFARGDRSIIISSTSVAAKPTTLDPKGELNTGKVTIPMVASGYQAVGNPYASAIKLDNIVFNDTLGNKKTIYIWDPKTLGSFNVGKFITCSGDGGSPTTYTYTGNTSAYDSKPGVIESSAAFMVKGNGGNIVFNESDKINSSSTIGMASRPVKTLNSFGRICKLYTDLIVIKNGLPVLADGVANTYNKNYDNGIDHFDAAKLTTFTSKEELSIKRNGELFAVERRNNLFTTDTIFLNISKLSQADYQFGFRPSEFNEAYSALLEDTYLNSITAFSLTTASVIPFSITGDPASAATNRFRIIFMKNLMPKSVQLTGNLNGNDGVLDWTMANTEDTDPTILERSTDGVHFSTVSTQMPGLDAAGNIAYGWTDKNLAPGNFYYRIVYNNELGKTTYSNIVKLSPSTKKGLPVIFPNPVTNGLVNLYMGQLPEAVYGIRVINAAGQVVYNSKLNHNNTNGTEQLHINAAKGAYTLEIITGKKTIQALSLLVQ